MKEAERRPKKKTKISLKLIKKRQEEYHSSTDSSDTESVGSDVESVVESIHSEKHSDEQPEKEQQVEQEVVDAKSKKLSSVISKILTQNQPILSKKRKLITSIDEQKLKAKAQKLISKEKKLQRNVGRVKPQPEQMSYEKILKKVATKGVVQLFNALRQVQKQVQVLDQDGVQKHEKDKPIVSKSTFLKALKEEPKETATVSKQKPLKTAKHWDEE